VKGDIRWGVMGRERNRREVPGKEKATMWYPNETWAHFTGRKKDSVHERIAFEVTEVGRQILSCWIGGGEDRSGIIQKKYQWIDRGVSTGGKLTN